MSIMKAYNLRCDRCDADGLPEPVYDMTTWPRWQTAAEVRKAARRAGWRRGPNGEDLCPDHAGGGTTEQHAAGG